MAWDITGNNGTNPNDNFVGTIDNEPLVIRTNKTERLRVDTNGNVGIGTTSPQYTLTVMGIRSSVKLNLRRAPPPRTFMMKVLDTWAS